MAAEPKYWFPAKRYGWGWGPPTVWQGWVVLGLFIALVATGAFVLLPRDGAWAFVAYCGVLCLILLVVCWIKGEPPGTRSNRGA